MTESTALRTRSHHRITRRAVLFKGFSLVSGVATLATLSGCQEIASAPQFAAPPTIPVELSPVDTPPAAPSPTQPAVGASSLTSAPTAVPPTPTAALPTPTPRPAATATPAGPRTGGRFVIARRFETNGLDPQFDATLSRQRLTPLLYSNLVRFSPELTIVPDLAERWEWAPDGSSITFTLRRGVQWHPPISRPVTATDVKWSFERLVERGTPRHEFTHIKLVEAIGEDGIRFHLDEPDGALLARLADCRWGAIVNPETIRRHGTARVHAVGTGPFMLESWTYGRELKLKKNPSYYVPNRPYLDEVVFQVIPDLDAIFAGIRAGGIHLITLDDVAAFVQAKDAGAIVVASKGYGTEFISFNSRHAPVSTLEVRQAIALALDRGEFVENGASGWATITAPVPPALTRWQLAPEQWQVWYKPDPARARQLLIQAGVEESREIPLLVPQEVASLLSSARLIQSQIQAIGLKIDLRVVDYPAWLRAFHSLDYVMTMNSTSGAPDPDLLFYRHLHSKAENWVMRDPDVDRLLEAGRAHRDDGVRKPAYDELQRVLLDRAIQIWTCSLNRVDALSRNVHGYVQHPSGNLYSLVDVWL